MNLSPRPLRSMEGIYIGRQGTILSLTVIVPVGSCHNENLMYSDMSPYFKDNQSSPNMWTYGITYNVPTKYKYNKINIFQSASKAEDVFYVSGLETSPQCYHSAAYQILGVLHALIGKRLSLDLTFPIGFDCGAIWLHTDPEHGFEAFGKLYSELRIVNPALFSDHVKNIAQMLYKVGVQRLSAHEVLKKHVLWRKCLEEKEHIISHLRNNAFISTNHGYKRLAEAPIHFSKQCGNLTDMSKLVSGSDMQWFEIDISYLKHQVCKSSPEGITKWRNFLQELGVTDFVKIVKVKKFISDIPHTVLKNMMLDDDCVSSGSIVIDYDSQDLTQLLSHVFSNGNKGKGKYLLRVLDELWDDYFSDKITGLCESDGRFRPFKSSIKEILRGVPWLASRHHSVPKVNSVKFLNDIGLKQVITLDDALSILDVWRGSKKPFRASISQMSKFYTYLWSEMSISKRKIVKTLHSQPFIFVPSSVGSTSEVLSGLLLSPSEVYWHDSIVSSIEQTKSTTPQLNEYMTHRVFSKMLCNVYPDLRHFFVREFGVAENPLLFYLQFLLQLSKESLPAHAAKVVVTREVIHCGPTDSSYMISLVRWALPYVQRYIYRMHTNEYSQLKLTGFRKVNSLKIVVVEKLCQKYVIKNFGIESKERECCCFLQDNVLYATRKSDSH
ncbi:hypothetical protein Tco_0682033 [Tanacetum coccineum]|uniref:Uncharacterized protein n=1 Tax=Tanacetum coccineum TaxID=301880 RepID=A0ABQ4XQ93_9ASTR